MSITNGTFPGVRIVDMPDLGVISDSSSFVGERAGSGRFSALALRDYATANLATTVKQYGAKGDGVTDDTLSIQACIDAVGAAGGGIVYVPRGTYKVSVPLVVHDNGVSLVGEGRKASVLASASAANDVLQLGNGTATVGYIDVSGLGFTASATKTGGCNINVTSAQHVDIRDVYMSNGWIGINIDNRGLQSDCKISCCEILNCGGPGICLGSQNSSTVVNEVFISDVTVASCSPGMLMSLASGVYGHGISFYQCSPNALEISVPTGKYVNDVIMTDCMFDSSTGDGITISGGGQVGSIYFKGGVANTNANSGINLIAGPVLQGVSIEGMEVSNNQQHGIVIDSGTGVTVADCGIYNNSQQTNNAYDGIGVGANVREFRVTNNIVGRGGWVGISQVCRQQYGLYIAGGTSDGYTITGNTWRGNVTAGLVDGGTGVNKAIANNLTT